MKHRYRRLLGDRRCIEKRRPLLAVDVVIRRRDGSIVLVKRLNPPFKDFYAILGGFVEYGETVEEAAIKKGEGGVWAGCQDTEVGWRIL